jgi:hypothetical protein
VKNILILSGMIAVCCLSFRPIEAQAAESTALDPTPCSHLSVEAAAKVTGIAFRKSEELSRKQGASEYLSGCTYYGPPVGNGSSITVTVSISHLVGGHFLAVLTQQSYMYPNEKLTAVSGLGDEAYSSPQRGLAIRKGATIYGFGLVTGSVSDVHALLLNMAKAYRY